MARAPERDTRPAPSSVTQLAGSLAGNKPTPGGSSAPLVAPVKKAPPRKAQPSRSRPIQATPAAPTTAAPSGSDMTLDAFLVALRQQESGGNYTAKNGTSTASGAYQYLDSTWNNYGGYKHAWQAPPSVQDQRARQDAAANLTKYGGDWRKVAAAHFAGSGWVDAHPDVNTWDQNPAPGSNNPTVSQYVASVFKNAGMATDSNGHPLPTGVSSATSGTTVAGTPTSVGSDPPLPANATPQQVNDYVAKHYGYLAAFLADPQIGPILRKAATEDWSEEDLTGAVTATDWWKTHSDSMRQWDSLNRLDHAKAKGQLDSMVASLTEKALGAGLTLSVKQLHDMGVNALRFGWNNDQITEAIRAQSKLDPSRAAPATDTLRQTAADYMVQLSPQALQQWTDQIQRGTTTLDAFTSAMKDQAKRERPWAARQIDDGQTTRQIVDPYRQMIGTTLNIDPNAVDFSLPKYAAVLDGQQDKTTGGYGPMSLSQAQQYLRGLPDYNKTPAAVDQAATFASSLAQDFGKLKV